MKIGIVTHILGNNFGGLLQNYALQYVLTQLGHQPKTIDFTLKQSRRRYIYSLCKQLLWSITKLRHPRLRRSFSNIVLADFIEKYIRTTKNVYSYTKDIVDKEKFDLIIVGSDQVWRPKYVCELENMYLKFVPNNIKKISYAASFGVDTWEYNDKQTNNCAKYVKRFDAISVRESSGVALCKEYLGVDATCVLDPTILAGTNAYKPLLKKKTEDQNYLFAYILDITQEKLAYVESMAESKGLKTIIKSVDKNANLSVEDWISMIANSSMVITDSFHGTVFSILFHREFFSIVNVARGGTRFASLLNPLGLAHRMRDISQLHSLESLSLKSLSIDWQRVDHILEDEREHSMKFLTNALKK